MIYTIVINQPRLNEFDLDFRHSALMAFFKNFFLRDIKKHIHIDDNGELWHWVKYSLIAEDLPKFRFNSKNSINPVIRDLELRGFIQKKILFNDSKKRMYFRQGKNFNDFFYYHNNKDLPNTAGACSIEGQSKQLVPSNTSKGGAGNTPPKFTPPTLKEVQVYCESRKNGLSPKKFFDYYEAGNWKDKDAKPVKNWKQKIITWEGRNQQVQEKSKNYDKEL